MPRKKQGLNEEADPKTKQDPSEEPDPKTKLGPDEELDPKTKQDPTDDPDHNDEPGPETSKVVDDGKRLEGTVTRIYHTLQCRNRNCPVNTVNRDVNAAKNMLWLFEEESNGKARHKCFARDVSMEQWEPQTAVEFLRHPPCKRGEPELQLRTRTEGRKERGTDNAEGY
jgi:hypothetical protein